MSFSNFLDVASKIPSLKKTEIVCHVAKKRCHVTPLSTGDDLSLRTTLSSPSGYDRELAQLLNKHTEFVEEEENKKYPFLQFSKELSEADKSALIWALYKATYDNLDEDREITCPNSECKSKFKQTISMDELIHDDTFVIWDEKDEEGNEVPFFQYRYPISTEYSNDVVYEFLTKLPSIQDNNEMLSMISSDVLQYNLEKIGSVFSRPQQITLITDAMRISSKSGKFESVETNNKNEILHTLEQFVPNEVSKNLLKKYREKFDKYAPRFYKGGLACPNCGHNFDYDVDLELEFFWRSLFSGESSE